MKNLNFFHQVCNSVGGSDVVQDRGTPDGDDDDDGDGDDDDGDDDGENFDGDDKSGLKQNVIV